MVDPWGLGIERTESEIALLRSLELSTSVSATCLLARYLSRILLNHTPAGTPHIAPERRSGLLVFQAGGVTSLGSVPIRLRFASLRFLIVIF
jgi:hypothetical protein